MAGYDNFRSSRQINAERDAVREARKQVLEKAKDDFERSERRREKARQAGEGTWMLASITERIDKEQKSLEKAKKRKKEKKKKKKHKKEKKRAQDSDSDNTSGDEEELWVESSSQQTKEREVKGPTLQRDSWMEGPLLMDVIPTVTRQELRDRKHGQEDKEKAEAARLLEQPGQHARELNPYWKDGGCGVPVEKPPSSGPAGKVTATGDGGLSWLRKAYQRCEQQAKDESRSLEEVAAERYGSLKKLRTMLREAEEASAGGAGVRDRTDRSREERDRDRRGESDRRDRDRDSRERDRSRRERKSRERDRRQEGRGRRDGDDCGDVSSKKRRFMMPSEDDHSTSYKPPQSSLASRPAAKFAKPADSDTDESDDGRRGRSQVSRSPAHRHSKQTAFSSRRSGESRQASWRKPEFKKDEPRPSASNSQPSDSSPSSDSSEEEEESESGREREEEEKKEQPNVRKLLSEDEMNSLGAKILRAEMMGQDDLARQLKTQLKQAQKARQTTNTTTTKGKPPPVAMVTSSRGEEEEEDEGNVVVLTRQGRDGMVRPLPQQEFDRDPTASRKRKMKKVDTHGQKGERSRYFDDDDRHDLKTLVHMEKLGTAEDQNAMFSRLAGRATEKTDDDFQVDDLFLTKAAGLQSGARKEEKERSKAILEHRKVSSAMEKCQRCFNNIPKHLLIAIGSKAYLSLPAHRSLTPGHCLLVPLQHTVAATALDEDVWQEIQTFRKQLVQMFAAQDQDVVFMETSMHHRHFPHMAIECIPLDRELGDMAPIYFKKAMLEVGPEWNSNKKVVDLSHKDIRHSVPKGFPYFSVDFGTQGGYAHVIEDENTFPAYFGREIVGGMMDAEPALWRKPHTQGFEDQRRKVLQFEQWWKPFDFTA